MTQSATRRTILATGAAALATGCGGKSTSNSNQHETNPATTGPGTAAPTATATATATGSEVPPSGKAKLASTGEIPEGGGKIFKEQKVVVTQPKKGDFKAFSAICTHEGCTVSKVVDGTIDCPCHGSKFHIADGSVAHGPAARPLPAETITVQGNSIHLT
ncbi:Rieske (2Fe-2S) protein [Streptomyces sp. NPDC004561]